MKLFTWLVGGPKLTFVTDLTPEDFIKKFEEAVDKPDCTFSGGFIGKTPILGKLLSQGHFQLNEYCDYRNSGLPYFNGYIRATDAGTEIVGTFCLHPIVIFSIAIFMALALCISGIVCVVSIYSIFQGMLNSLWGLVFASSIIIGVIAIAVFMDVISKNKQKVFIEFLQKTFGATLIELKE